ncbi:unnamed protein product [Heligmosomoides polygyrus]|uniref:Uncharacterized protein n=1 Tax=Heligmosomoides polygyrus TaxID=6339 RepID=A0A183F2H0_HELPZ|nr:unnamed protein product [Heligmosomoides polygyrus]
MNVKKTEYVRRTSMSPAPSRLTASSFHALRSSKINGIVVRPVAKYGAECWAANKEAETRVSVMEANILRWTAGVTRMHRIRNDVIRQKFGVAPIADKMREARLRWYGQILREKEDSVRKIGYRKAA